MGTKNNPGVFDCYGKALPDEPMFTLLARDPRFQKYVNKWAEERIQDILCGERPVADWEVVHEAQKLAITGAAWRRDNFGLWRIA